MLIIDAGTTYIKSISDKGIYFRSLNRQIEYGTDIISRLDSVKDNDDFYILRKLLNESIQEHLNYHNIKFKLNENNIECKDNTAIYIIGNSVIEHFYLNLNISGLKKKPFIRDKKEVKQYNPYFIPGFYSYIGSDILPLLIKMDNMEENNAIAFDFGTNCEIILKKDNRFLISSAPAGPAFENIIDQKSNILLDVNFNGAFSYITSKEDSFIDNILPKAMIKLLYFLHKTAFLEKSGNMKYDFMINNQELSMEKIRDFQKAKAAVSSTWKILKKYYLKSKEIEKALITGNMISDDIKRQLQYFEIIPNIDTEYIKDGFKMFFNIEKSDFFKKIEEIRRKVIHIPQYNIPEYEKIYINDLNF